MTSEEIAALVGVAAGMLLCGFIVGWCRGFVTGSKETEQRWHDAVARADGARAEFGRSVLEQIGRVRMALTREDSQRAQTLFGAASGLCISAGTLARQVVHHSEHGDDGEPARRLR
jgi:hypothetical protein